ncbi:MAG TPA: 3-hydroxyacyl-ACP dehydratase FabZ family protein [Pseudolabrys sp.]|jgi:3-hydroxyacyl-[acyl-carrier-protein] dehydratase|nr:3-hydroxyacyl-ACP dehydratase FabZ family protein [Pseudolabrys sp.]
MRLEYFQLIDRILDLNLGDRTIRSEAVVPTQSTIFEGHFPGHPLMPGVLLIETMAQTCGWLVLAATNFTRMAFLASVREAKFRTFVTPGQVLTISAHLDHEGSGFAVAQAKITTEGKPLCDASLTFRIIDFPNPEMHRKMRETAIGLGFPAEALADG